ncbi:MAG: ABC transporter permease [Candidatus Nomurabacteria bacterium]|jgi:putative ABC transport system permease protein|nr:ABC transporter permease [Candidatus Nomurabacteria bacterium]
MLPISFRLAKNSLKAHRGRTILTTLGIMVGAFLIALVLILSRGLQLNVFNQTSFDDDIILVRNTDVNQNPLNPSPIASAAVLSEKDLQGISNVSGIDSVAPMMFLSGKISKDNNDFDSYNIVATNSDFPATTNLEIVSGSWLSDVDSGRNVVVLGERLARNILGDNEANNQNIIIKDQNFTVIGVLKSVDQPLSITGVDIDRTAFMSLSNGKKFTNDSLQIGQIIAKVNAKSDAKIVANDITKKLASNHVDDNDFQVLYGDKIMKPTEQWLDNLTTVSLIFAVIALLVGGVSVMNIMLASVTERVREIGIRKAVGATKRHILEQFLVESLMITFTGGFIGLVLAYLAMYFVSIEFSIPIAFDWWIFVISLGAPILVGLLFGLLPAVRAANHDPISALKQQN